MPYLHGKFKNQVWARVFRFQVKELRIEAVND